MWTISVFSNTSNLFSLVLSNALTTIDFANIWTDMDCFDEVSNFENNDWPHLSSNLDSPSLEKFSVIKSPGRYTDVRPGNSSSLIAFSVLPLVEGYRKNDPALAPKNNTQR